MRLRRWTGRGFATALLWLCVAQAGPTAELEVVGKIAVFADVEPTAEGQQIVRGHLSDEVGRPVEGTLNIKGADGKPVAVRPCPWLETDESDAIRRRLDRPGLIVTGADGEYCFVTEETKGLAMEAHAQHFVEATHDLDIGLERALTRPRFIQAPASIELFEDTSHVVQLLGRSERNPPRGARLTLHLRCRSSHPIGGAALDRSRMQRFEFEVPAEVSPGTCQFIATVSAPHHDALGATRSVLVVDRIELDVEDQSDAGKFTRLVVSAKGGAESSPPLAEGLVEAREEGAFVALSPVRAGRAEIELERGQSARDIELTYVPASAAYVAGSPTSAQVAPLKSGFRWAGVHTAGLLLFALWLGYAWLRPRRGQEGLPSDAPPRKAVLRSAGGKTGPVSGRAMDAHTGSPISGVVLELYAIKADSEQRLEAVESDEDGHFRFEARFEQHALLKLRAGCDDYMTLVSVARSARMTVHLTHCRRAVVQGLVAWARSFGRPYNRRPAATPGSVEATARASQDQETATWARQVAEAAYAPDRPSRQLVEGLGRPERPGPSES